jgi:hypothetical protein
MPTVATAARAVRATTDTRMRARFMDTFLPRWWAFAM